MNNNNVDEMVAEELAFRRLHPVLLKTHKGQFVAIYQEQLVDYDEDQVALYLRVDEKYPDAFVLIAPINEQAEEIYHFRSPHVQALSDDGNKIQSLRETLKREIDMLDESQLLLLAEFIDFIKSRPQNRMETTASIQQATPEQRAQELREWLAGLPKSGVSLPDEAFDRGNIYP